jgi:uncharacterized phage-like protein YoqJ
MIIAGTGHRPQKLGGFAIPNPIYNYVQQEAERLLIKLKPSLILSGMTVGYDTLLAELAIKLKIDFNAIVPFIGQEKKWPKEAQIKYNNLLKQAKEVKIVCEGEYAPEKMQIRNQYLVDHCQLLLAAYNGSGGGTNNCIQYAHKMKKEIIVIDPKKAPMEIK